MLATVLSCCISVSKQRSPFSLGIPFPWSSLVNTSGYELQTLCLVESLKKSNEIYIARNKLVYPIASALNVKDSSTQCKAFRILLAPTALDPSLYTYLALRARLEKYGDDL